MRLVFVDEAGLSNPVEEPYVVAAGIVVDADRQWRVLQERMAEIAANDPPPVHKGKAFYHAHALYAGRTPFDAKNGWDEERRLRVLKSIVSIPKEFGVTVLGASIRKDDARLHTLLPGVKSHYQMALIHALIQVLLQTERLMRALPNDEVAKVIIEDSPHVRQQVKLMSRAIALPAFWEGSKASDLLVGKIVGRPQFEEKEDDSLLQVADACAYVIKRVTMRDPNIYPFYYPIAEAWMRMF